MRPRLDAIGIGGALLAVGFASGAVMVGVVGPEPQVITRTQVTTMPAPPPRTVIHTVEVERTPDRASRGADRDVTPSTSTPRGLGVSEHSDAGGRETYQAYARTLVPADQWPCLKSLWTRESHWNPTLVGALVDGVHVVGIPQLRGLKATDGWRYQIKRGLAYIDHRHGTPCAAWAYFGREGWY